MSNPNEMSNPVAVFCRSSVCENTRLVISSIAVSLLLLVVFVGVSLSYCVLKLHPAANFLILFVCLVLLAYVEALHYACVAVEKWDMKQYTERYPRAVKCHGLIDTPVKVKKFLVGRQFFVIFVVFFIAQITSFHGKLEYFHLLICMLSLLMSLFFKDDKLSLFYYFYFAFMLRSIQQIPLATSLACRLYWC